MKVIGKTTGGYLLEASENEIARIEGFYWPGQDEYPRRHKALNTGDEIKIDKVYEHLRNLGANRGALAKIAAELHAFAERLDVQDPIVRALAGLDEIKLP